MTIAYRYHRFSSKGQDKGSSIERQDERTMEMVVNHGWTLAPGDPIEDRGRSAWKGDHLAVGNLGHFKKRVDAGEIEPGSVLVIENFDRLSRESVKKARRWVEDVTEAGVGIAVHSLNKVFNEASLSGENIVDLIQYLIEAQRSNAESQRKSDFRNKVNEKQITKAKGGEIYANLAPLWLEQRGGKWVANQERAAVVVQIFEWCAGDLGYAAICKRLNEQIPAWTTGWKTKSAEWKVGYVRDILLGPMVEGEFHRKAVGEDRDEVILDYYPRVVPAELVARARQAIKGRQRTGGPRAAMAPNLFAGVSVCAECGGTMAKTVNHNKQGKRYFYFICRAARAGGCPNSIQFRYDLFEDGALREILHLTLDNTHFVKADETGPLLAKVADLKKERDLTMAKVELIADQLEAGSNSPTLMARLDAREAEVVKIGADLAQAEEELERARGKVSADEHIRRVMEVRSAIDSEDPETAQQARRLVRMAIQNVVEKIEFTGHRVGKREVVRTVKMSLLGRHVLLWFDGEGNVIKKRNNLGMYDRDPDNGLTRVLTASADDPDAVKGALDKQLQRWSRGRQEA